MTAPNENPTSGTLAAYNEARADLINLLQTLTEFVKNLPELGENSDAAFRLALEIPRDADPLWREIGPKIAAIRGLAVNHAISKGMSGRAAAERLGISPQAVSNLIQRTYEPLIAADYRAGATPEEIATKYGLGPRTVKTVIAAVENEKAEAAKIERQNHEIGAALRQLKQ